MKAFKFRLKALLKIREHIEKERQKDHAIALQRVQEQNETLKSILSAKESTCQGQAKRFSSPFSVADMLIYSRYLVRLKRDQVAGHELSLAFEKEERKQQVKLTEATKQKKIFEKLEEKQETAFLKSVHKFEMNENDEIAIQNYRQRHN